MQYVKFGNTGSTEVRHIEEAVSAPCIEVAKKELQAKARPEFLTGGATRR